MLFLYRVELKFIVWNGIPAFGSVWNTHKVVNSQEYLEWDRGLAMSGRRRGLNGVWNRMRSPKPPSEHLCQIYWSVPQGSSCLSALNHFLLTRSLTYKEDSIMFSQGSTIAGVLHRSAVIRAFSYGKYHLDFSPMYPDFFVRHVFPNWINYPHDALSKLRKV